MRGDAASRFERIKQKAAYKMVRFQGDLTKGTLSGGVNLLGTAIQGKYLIVGDRIFVTVWTKPELVSWPEVDAMLREFIESD